jgi:hypothetical protein
MKISRQNYEAYFLDYLEGKLDSDQMVEFLSFLKSNPDLENELRGFENIQINPGGIIFPDKASLKKTIADIPLINESNFEEYCIAKIEGDLRGKDEIILEGYLFKHPEKRKDLELFTRTKLKPEPILFKDKTLLKKSYVGVRVSRRALLTYVSAAASILILFVVFLSTDWKIFQNKNKVALTTTDSSIQKAELIPDEKIQPESDKLTEPGRQGLESNIERPLTEEGHGREEKFTAAISGSGKNEDLTIQESFRKEFTIEEIPKLLEPVEIIHFEQSELLTDLRFFEGIENKQPDKAGYLDLLQFGIKEFKSEILLEKEEINPYKLTVWDLADAGVKGVNKLVGWNMKFNKIYNENGDITALAFNSSALSFNTSLKK